MINLYSIRSKLIIFFLIIMLIPSILITTMLYKRSTEILMSKRSDSIINGLAQANRVMENIFFSAEQQLTSVIINFENYQLLKDFRRKPDYSNDYITNTIWKRLYSLYLSNPHVESIYLYLYDQKAIISSYEIRKVIEVNNEKYYGWLGIPIEDTTNSSGWVRTVSTPSNIAAQGFNVFMFKKHIKDIHTGQIIGEAAIAISERSIYYNLFETIKEGKNNEIMLLDNEGEILSASKSSAIGKNIIDKDYIDRVIKEDRGFFVSNINGQKTLIAYITSEYTKWKYVSMIPMNEIALNISEVRNITLLANLLSALIVIFFAVIFSETIYEPIFVLKNSMKSAEEGDLKVQIRENRKDEFDILNKGFNSMINQIQKLIDELYHEKLLKKEAELKNLQSQINPHFLYNTLDSIHWLSRLGKTDKVSELTFSLSNFYKLSLSGGRDTITVEETIDLIKEYLNIQRIRYDDKFIPEIDVEEETAGYKVLPLLIQPLVENAISHGIETKKGQGYIYVGVSSVNQNILFTIKDNGSGIQPEKLNSIRKSLSSDDVQSGDNFALINIQKRIKLYYGNEYGLTIDSEPDKGTAVYVLLPKVK